MPRVIRAVTWHPGPPCQRTGVVLLTRMDEGETLLRAGDCLVQRGTNHAWSNRTDKPCRVAFILVSADAGS